MPGSESSAAAWQLKYLIAELLLPGMKVCALCQKGSVLAGRRSFLRSHYNPTTTVRKYPNLQWAKLGDAPRIKVCVKCLKNIAK